MKNIIGLDLGTNSIGWAKISVDDNGNKIGEVKLGSRIIPMSQDILGKFDSGVTESQTAQRTTFRGIRRLRERCLLRRERLLRVLHILNFLPPHFDQSIGWNKNDNKTYGKFLDDSEPKIAWKKAEDGKMKFVFMDSFNQMLAEFAKVHPELVARGKKIPLDWTIYYLRKKALKEALTKQELAWILLNFNQKRGYYQLRGEDEDDDKNELRTEEYICQKVVDICADEDSKGAEKWYDVKLENGMVYRRKSKTPLNDWIGKIKEFIVTTDYESDGTTVKKRSFRAPSSDDWNLQKKKTEQSIALSNKTVGEFIYDALLNNPEQKIIGKLVKTIERKLYKDELVKILSKQSEFIKELSDKNCLEDCIIELYPQNKAHQDSLRRKDLCYLLIDDLLFYQRPLKSKKSLISNCPFESYNYVDKETGEIKVQHIKCIAKSNPYYQEFRLWQFVQNLRLFNKEDKEVTSEYLKDEEAYVGLFNFLNDCNKITQEELLTKYFGFKKPTKKNPQPIPLRWNYVEDKEYPCNTTRYEMLKAFNKIKVPANLLTREMEQTLWHLLYSISDRNEFIQAIGKFVDKYNNDTNNSAKLPKEEFVDAFKKIKPFKNEYGAYSEKATKKLLGLMRMGSKWKEEKLHKDVLERIAKIIDGDIDEQIRTRMGARNFCSTNDFSGLPVWLASYVAYGIHSEDKDAQIWTRPEDLQSYIYGFKQHSMRNPIVEQIVLETLRTVLDIWRQEGKIDEIHVELGRSMKSTKEQRERMTKRNTENENTNMRIKKLLLELGNDDNIKDVRPYSPMQQDILRIYEEGALLNLKKEDKDYDEISKISKLSTPDGSQLRRYKLWLEQKYTSPYTGKVIPLSRLFTTDYQIEHVIPKSRYFDDSFTNKVICEAEVNQLKGGKLGLEFIKANGGQIVHCTNIGDVKVFTENEYRKYVAEHYENNKSKRNKLLLDDIPEEFIQRQMNDSRYISKVIKSILSNVVREDGEIDAVSKNVISCTGGITDKLKEDWGLKDVWNTIVTPRFERMNQLTGSSDFGHWENKEGKRVFQTTMPFELQRGFSKKRIDHRHHAMDALVIACASRNIISYLNNESACDTKRRYDLKNMLTHEGRMNKPWNTFTQDAHAALDNIVVSFKNYVRVINKASNYYEHYDKTGVKKIEPQKSASWAIRKPLHKDTIFGRVNLRRKKEVNFKDAVENAKDIVNKDLRSYILNKLSNGNDVKTIVKQFKGADYKFKGLDVKKVLVFYFTDTDSPYVAVRKTLDDTFDKKKIESITDTGIQRILLNYLEAKGGNPAEAFTPEGIVDMNENISLYNNGKQHKPIYSVRVSETMGEKFNIGETGNKKYKFAEAQKGTNLFLAIYTDNEGNRSYKTISFKFVVERLKQGLGPVPETDTKGNKLLMYLSPNDLVYVPREDEAMSPVDKHSLDKSRIYKMVSSTGSEVYFVPCHVASIIKDKVEFRSLNKMEKSLDGFTIKSVCWKLEVDRLGNIIRVIR